MIPLDMHRKYLKLIVLTYMVQNITKQTSAYPSQVEIIIDTTTRVTTVGLLGVRIYINDSSNASPVQRHSRATIIDHGSLVLYKVLSSIHALI